MKPTFWFSAAGLLLMLLAFLVQQSAKITFVEKALAPTAANARQGLQALQAKNPSGERGIGLGGKPPPDSPSLVQGERGFGGLATLYSEFIASKASANRKLDKILRFVDPRAAVPSSKGLVNLVIVEWAHGQKTETSYEELQELITTSVKNALWPWQFSLFVAGACLQVGTIAVTHFPRKKKHGQNETLPK